jgi:putative endonuclease
LVEHLLGKEEVTSSILVVGFIEKVKYHVYVLKSKIVDRYYVGSTKDLKRRLTEHNNRRKHWTSKFQPWEIIYSEEYNTLSEARRKEKWLKSKNSIAEKLKLIREIE